MTLEEKNPRTEEPPRKIERKIPEWILIPWENGKELLEDFNILPKDGEQLDKKKLFKSSLLKTVAFWVILSLLSLLVQTDLIKHLWK